MERTTRLEDVSLPTVAAGVLKRTINIAKELGPVERAEICVCDWTQNRFYPVAHSNSIEYLEFDSFIRENSEAVAALARFETVSLSSPLTSAVQREARWLLTPIGSDSSPAFILCLALSNKDREPSCEGIESLRRLIGAEYELRKRLVELAAVRQMMSHSLSNALHDLCAPLTAVRRRARAIREELSAASATSQHLDSLAQQADELMAAYNTFRCALGDQAMRVELIDVPHIWDKVIGLLRRRAESKSVVIVRECDGYPSAVGGDSSKLLVAAYKLLSSVIDNAAAGSEIRIKISPWQEFVRSSIVDSMADGLSGIAELLVEKSGRESLNEGSALSAVRGIVWLHGGRVSASRNPGGGYSLTMILPVVVAARVEEARSAV